MDYVVALLKKLSATGGTNRISILAIFWKSISPCKKESVDARCVTDSTFGSYIDTREQSKRDAKLRIHDKEHDDRNHRHEHH